MLKEVLQGKPVRHPLHPFLVHFPIGLFALSLVLDLAGLLFPDIPHLFQAAFYSMALGVLTALLAAVPGFVDYLEIREDHSAKKTAAYHALLNLAAVVVYAVNLGLRYSAVGESAPGLWPLMLSLAGVAILSVSGYLGGMMVYDDGIAVGRHRRRTALPKETIRITRPKPADKDQPQARRTGWVPVADASRLNDEETMRVEIDSEVLVVAKLGKEFFAFQEFCTHRYGPLSEGSFHDGQVQCPWHRSCFDLRTGNVKQGPAKVGVRTYRVEVQAGKICVELPGREPEPA